ncbi:unnamed protein product [Caenorhabditis angaria]|uniref:Acyl_transf_3 domain-containing protein n=1 Tax=Caenorhabditis angaria TaxID=860376 RepID=A0A9P1N276_9PELO|nr:unnamed protein product [Caenorhabditis angaria]
MSATKLLNLQGIRGIAIIAVLGFHFFPNYFPNGYLGVDQFFVLSGFLMCCEPIYKFPTQFKQCPEFLEEVVHHLDEYKPDYAFYLTRAINIGTNYTDDFKNDPIYQSILNETRHLVDKIKYKLFIVNSIPSVNITKIASLSDDIKNNIPRDEIDSSLEHQIKNTINKNYRLRDSLASSRPGGEAG